MKKICIVEDDPWILWSLKLYLQNSAYKVATHDTGIWAIEFFQNENPDLIILDINLPWASGIEICTQYRKSSNVPIIMLTARWAEWDKVIGLESWADDYIPKPFSPRELLARIKTIIRRSSSGAIDTDVKKQDFTSFSIDYQNKQVFVNDHDVDLTKNEYEIFEKICKAGGTLVTREFLMKEVIGYENYIYDRTLDTHIKNIRKKLKDTDLVQTVRWKWYKLKS